MVKLMIKVENLNFEYEDNIVLQDINFELEPGGKYALIGRNGAGKSTLIKLILNLRKSQTGKLSINGIPHRSKKWKNEVSYLPEKFAMYPQLTGLENMKFLGHLSKKTFDIEKAKQVMRDVNLDPDSRLPVKAYSKGMTQRLGLASIIYQDSNLIILDEPTSGLDPVGRRDILNIIKNLEGKTILMSSHHFEEVKYTCNSVLSLEDKRISLMTTEQFEKEFLTGEL